MVENSVFEMWTATQILVDETLTMFCLSTVQKWSKLALAKNSNGTNFVLKS